MFQTFNNVMEFFKLSSIKIISSLLIVCSICSCSLFEPFVDRRRNAGVQDVRFLYVGRSQTDAPAICYNGLWTNQKTLQELADAECRKHGTGTHAEKVDNSFFTCKMFLPSHAYYKCVK